MYSFHTPESHDVSDVSRRVFEESGADDKEYRLIWGAQPGPTYFEVPFTVTAPAIHSLKLKAHSNLLLDIFG